uniref:Uncharacterized protein n=1 Tax=Rousettus aegyptiacus TaxID=9407 RepID=A0A7J8CIA1_ROUAE|nr:hypothetical protein HJG63_009079 [Rousettus aegyptiacus]
MGTRGFCSPQSHTPPLGGHEGCQPRARTQPFSKEKVKKLKKKERKKLIYTKSPIRPGWVEGALLGASTGHQSMPASCLAAPPPSVWNCSCPTSPPQVGTTPPSRPGRAGVVSTPRPLLVPLWILHDVNHGFELCSCPLPESPTLPSPCLPRPQRHLAPVGQAGPCPAPAGMRSTDSAMD